ncbi:rhomboid family intramembrane serine protease [Actinorhabdospora filicis]|uniref:Rhomboid family intramembrane serine protease n=2 Tax=Actinorhabdospora filicis TaxID=1785913 RepID=A0A9W6SRV4_9ACTN|nr:rhomboid family intramembrane serine protease [Actinorhabdospora filicis]
MHEAAVGFQCPECVAEGRRTVRQTKGHFGGGVVGRREYVTYALVAINVAVFLLDAVLTKGRSLGGFGIGGGSGYSPAQLWGGVIAPSFTQDGQLYTGVMDGGWYRLLTSGFVHYGVLHLLMNMFALWFVGRGMERTIGHVRFAALYLVSGLGGAVAVYLFSDPRSVTVGASGAIFGLFGALVFVNRRLGRELQGVIAIIAINVIFSFSVSGISIAGHLGGLVTGALLALGIAYAPRKYRIPVQVGTFVLVLAVLAVLVVMRTNYLEIHPELFG